MSRRFATSLLLVGLAAWSGPGRLAAQQLGPSTGGLVALDQGLRFLGHDMRVLMIGAHPDDEDTEFLAVMARGFGAETAYLALTRGEGGQNLIGDELGPALGVLRTEELLGARSMDGARQFFTRAYDFGFSKSLDDTWRFWPRDSVLKDVVRVIRRFRPQIVVAVFSGTPRDGHGQHQASGWAAREAFAAAGDPTRFPELAAQERLGPWSPLKLYQSARFDTAGATVSLQGGVLDRAVGQSYLQIAMRGRSLHRSQDMGSLQRIGPSTVRLRLIEDRTGAGAGLFAGVDTIMAGSARVALGEDLAPVRAARSALEPQSEGPRAVAVRDQIDRIDDVLFVASGVLCDAVSDNELVTPGQRIQVTLSCWNSSSVARAVTASVVRGGTPEGGFSGRRLAPGELASETVQVSLPAEAPLTQPYYLETAPAGAFYHWPAGRFPVWSLPFEPPYLAGQFRLDGGGSAVKELVYRYADQALGEVRRPVRIIPRLAVSLDPASGLWAAGSTAPKVFTVTLRHGSADTTRGSVQLEGPAGWDMGPVQTFQFAGQAAEQEFRFMVRPAPGATGSHQVRAVARDSDGRRYTIAIQTIEYPHIHVRQLVHPAAAVITLAPLALPQGLRIGYIRGAADRIPEALAALGIEVSVLSPDSLRHGALGGFTTIVVGPRAYETEPAVALASQRLIDFARQGGTVVVQYQQQVFFRGGFAPFALSLTDRPGEALSFRVSAPRVAEEDAPVTMLVPGHPVFQAPNRIGPDDWSGWVQERGLYFARSWDPAWTPLLEMADQGEAPLRGSLLVAPLGKGLYVYTGLSFFRELPAAVPGATRLFLNLLALRAPTG
jgi:LmbE family N-acetylglucosaminyl deacetylase